MDKKPITDVRVGKHRIYTEAVGDTWDPAWSDDGRLYFGGNDGSGWNKACSNNLFFNVISGEDPFNLKVKRSTAWRITMAGRKKAPTAAPGNPPVRCH
jgi:hypothetical protein